MYLNATELFRLTFNSQFFCILYLHRINQIHPHFREPEQLNLISLLLIL